MNNRMRILTTPSPTIAHLNMATRFHHLSHSMPETLNTRNKDGHFKYDTYQATQTRGHTHNTTPFKMAKPSHEPHGFYHR